MRLVNFNITQPFPRLHLCWHALAPQLHHQLCPTSFRSSFPPWRVNLLGPSRGHRFTSAHWQVSSALAPPWAFILLASGFLYPSSSTLVDRHFTSIYPSAPMGSFPPVSSCPGVTLAPWLHLGCSLLRLQDILCCLVSVALWLRMCLHFHLLYLSQSSPWFCLASAQSFPPWVTFPLATTLAVFWVYTCLLLFDPVS